MTNIRFVDLRIKKVRRAPDLLSNAYNLKFRLTPRSYLDDGSEGWGNGLIAVYSGIELEIVTVE